MHDADCQTERSKLPSPWLSGVSVVTGHGGVLSAVFSVFSGIIITEHCDKSVTADCRHHRHHPFGEGKILWKSAQREDLTDGSGRLVQGAGAGRCWDGEEDSWCPVLVTPD